MTDSHFRFKLGDRVIAVRSGYEYRVTGRAVLTATLNVYDLESDDRYSIVRRLTEGELRHA